MHTRSFWKDRPVAVTGGAGFIGHHLVQRLCELGARVTVIDNLSGADCRQPARNVRLVPADIRIPEDLADSLVGVDTVFHLAAMSRNAPSVDALEECVSTNVIGTKNIVEACLQHRVRRLIYSASSTCYGSTPVPHRVDGPTELLNPYSWSKHAGEQLALMMGRCYGLSTCSLRYFNVYGRGEPTSGPYALVLGIFVERTRLGLPLEIHGDGLQFRDFVHVSDVVSANLEVAEASGIDGRIFNVGSGRATTIREIADSLSPNQTYAPRRAADSAGTLADLSDWRGFSWQPQVTIEDGLRMALREPGHERE